MYRFKCVNLYVSVFNSRIVEFLSRNFIRRSIIATFSCIDKSKHYYSNVLVSCFIRNTRKNSIGRICSVSLLRRSKHPFHQQYPETVEVGDGRAKSQISAGQRVTRIVVPVDARCKISIADVSEAVYTIDRISAAQFRA